MIIAISRASKHSYKYAKNQIKKSFFLYLLQIIQKVIIIHYNRSQKIYKGDNTTKGKEMITWRCLSKFLKEELILHYHFTYASPVKLPNHIAKEHSAHSSRSETVFGLVHHHSAQYLECIKHPIAMC